MAGHFAVWIASTPVRFDGLSTDWGRVLSDVLGLSNSQAMDDILDAPIRILGPETLVAAVPYLLGFHPEKSLIAVWQSPGEGGVLATMRADLPDSQEPEMLDAVAAALCRPLHSLPPDAIPYLVLVPLARGEYADPLPYRELVDHLLTCLKSAGRPAGDVVCFAEGRWWSYLCANAACCELCGSAVSPRVELDIASRFVVAGRHAAESRAVLVEEIATAPASVVRRMRGLIVAQCEQPARARVAKPLAAAQRARSWRALGELVVDPQSLEPDDHAAVLIGLRDVNLRDAFIAILVQRRQPLDPVLGVLRQLVTMAPRRYVAAVAATLAMLTYLAGDGARAWVAIDRAQQDDPDHTLAFLVGEALNQGRSPRFAREMFESFDSEALRRGKAQLRVGTVAS